ncbi:MAG TPA: aminotransferase class V-fold PLP-dependent enzyme [Micromonosporaceae bacterium]
MELRRRTLLGAAAAAGVMGSAARCDPAPPSPAAAPSAPPLEPRNWSSVRGQLALDADVAHLATFVFASHPATVRAAIDAHRRGLDADPIRYLAANESRLDEAVAAAAAAYLGGSADGIAFTDSTTMGLGLLYAGLRLRAGAEMVTTAHDFYATHEALRLRSVRDGVTVRRVRLYRDPATATVDEVVSSLARAVTGRTAVVALTWVHSSTGVKLPVRAIADALRARNPEALLCVDAVHGLGAEDATPEQLGCDFFVAGGHKWLFGPRGTGLVWGTDRGWTRFSPAIPSFDRRAIGAWLGYATGGAPAGPAATPGGYHSFEHRWALAEAFALHAALGRDRVAARTHELAATLKDGLAGLPGVRLITPKDPDLSAGIVCCDVPGVSPAQAVGRLAERRVVASSTPYEPSYLRFGTTIFNNERDVTAAVEAVRSVL